MNRVFSLSIHARHWVPILLLAAIILFSATSCTEQEMVTLKLKLEEGRSYGLHMEMNQETTMTSLGNTTMNQILGMDMSCDVKAVDDQGNMTIEFTYDSVNFQQKSPQMNVSYNSSTHRGKVPDIAKGYAALVGKKITALITPTGYVSDIKGFEAIYNAVIKSIDFPPGPQRDQLIDQFREQFGPESLREMMEQSMGYLPSKEVAVGERWNEQIELTRGFPMRMDNTYHLQSRDAKKIKIGVESKLSSLPGASLKMGPVQISYDLTGNQSGIFYVDEDTGWITTSELTQDMSGNMKMGSSTSSGGNMSMPFTMKSTIRYTSFEGIK